MGHPASTTAPEDALHIWRAWLDSPGWPGTDSLPAEERERAARIVRPQARRRWLAARWALRNVLGRYLDREPDGIELRYGERGKPGLAEPDAALRFNLSHSGELALIALAERREVGVDVQRIGKRHPSDYYSKWARREAIAKCHGVSLWTELPDRRATASKLDAPVGYAAAVAIVGEDLPSVRSFDAELIPVDSSACTSG